MTTRTHIFLKRRKRARRAKRKRIESETERKDPGRRNTAKEVEGRKAVQVRRILVSVRQDTSGELGKKFN